MDVKKIVYDYLKKNNYDGLYNIVGGCACKVDDLEYCGEMNSNCKAGIYKNCDICREPCEFDFCIKSKKESKR